MPGDRLGYVLIPEQTAEWRQVFAAVAGASRMIGHVCAPSIVQKAVAKCVDAMPDLTVYERNRNLLLEALPAMGYECARPDGAFYLFFRAPRGDGASFCEEAKAKDLLVVPAATFGCPNHLRIAYCVDTAVVERSLPVFRALIEGK
jgi:aspartate aminotransferase